MIVCNITVFPDILRSNPRTLITPSGQLQIDFFKNITIGDIYNKAFSIFKICSEKNDSLLSNSVIEKLSTISIINVNVPEINIPQWNMASVR